MSDKSKRRAVDASVIYSANPQLAAVQRWVDRVVVGLNLCPFARRELDQGRVRFVLSVAESRSVLIDDLSLELERLLREPSIETTLVVHPGVLQDFYDFNEFLGDAEQLLRERELEGIFQVASFHPDYQFAGTNAEDAENYSNRSPYPVLHILREESVARAVANHPDISAVPTDNIAVLQRIGVAELHALKQACLHG